MHEGCAPATRALERDVAIKVLMADTAQTPESRKRLEREAKIISSLNHPRI